MCIEFNRGDDTRTKISKRENCTYRDVNKYLQIQIQEKYSKEKLFQVVELILQHVACNARAISSQEWTASKTLTTDGFSHPVTPGIICKVLDLGFYVIYLNSDRNRTWVGGLIFLVFCCFFLKKGLDISLKLGLSFFHACLQKKVKIHVTGLQFPHIQVEPLGRVGTFCEH